MINLTIKYTMMSKEKINILKSTCVPLPIENVDTDQIIPARFLTATTRQGFGDNLFRDWRYLKDGKPDKSFVLNDKAYSGKILVTGKNFGCGSSREHAVWAIYDYGFRVVISSFFADIFMNNSINNGLLPVILQEDTVRDLIGLIQQDPSTEVIINLEAQTVEVPSTGAISRFAINQYKKECLINGFNDIDYLISIRDKVVEYENRKGLT
jgi:3-isopropylmalate/(R)-2-methylmalate dehydratase small subunit